MYDLKKLVESNTIEGVINYEKVMASLDSDYVNPIVAKKTDKEKLELEAVSTLVKELGLEDGTIDSLKLYIKKMGGSTDEAKESNLKLTNAMKELQDKYDTEVTTRTELEATTKLDKQMAAIKGLGVKDEEQIDYLHYKFNKQVTDEVTLKIRGVKYYANRRKKNYRVFRYIRTSIT